MDNFLHKENFNKTNPSSSYSDMLSDESIWEIRSLHLYRTPEIWQSVSQDAMENLNMSENPAIHFQSFENIPEDRDEKYSSEFHPLDPIEDVSLFNIIEKNNDQISSSNKSIICSEPSQSKNAQTAKEIEPDTHNLLKDSDDVASRL